LDIKKNTNISDYIGLYKDGKRHGQGTLVLEDGSTYVGEFKNLYYEWKNVNVIKEYGKTG